MPSRLTSCDEIQDRQRLQRKEGSDWNKNNGLFLQTSLHMAIVLQRLLVLSLVTENIFPIVEIEIHSVSINAFNIQLL